MIFRRLAALFVTLSWVCSAAGIDGKWRLTFLGPAEQLPKTVSEVILDLHSDGGKLSGTVHAGNWPGDASLIQSNVNGDNFSFTAIGTYPWSMRSRSAEASGLPKLTFSGSVKGNEVRLKLLWDNVMLSGTPPRKVEYEMTGSRISE